VLLAIRVQQAIQTAALIPFWTLSRGEQVITCELIPSDAGHSILRCGCGPQTVRSQFISSAAAATAVSEVWRAALLLQGFRGEPSALCPKPAPPAR
jgi:hypothetical protein